jgi:hypothetical protein
VVDPCWPQRYNLAARYETNAAFAPQVQNGQVLDQTVWNYHFELNSDKLTPSGLEKLAYLARRRPQPDPVVYLQTAQDVFYDAANPDKLAENRQDLDGRRVAAVQKFLNAQTAGRHVDFQVLVHDPADVSISATYVNAAISAKDGRARGGLATGGGGGAGAGGGAGGGAAGGR